MANQDVQNVGAEKVAAYTRLLIQSSEADEAIRFYKNVLGAVELERSELDPPYIFSAKLKMGSLAFVVSAVTASDNTEDSGDHMMKVDPLGSGAVNLWLLAPDFEAAVTKAEEAGGQVVGKITTGPGPFNDERPIAIIHGYFGFTWFITTPDELVAFAAPAAI